MKKKILIVISFMLVGTLLFSFKNINKNNEILKQEISKEENKVKIAVYLGNENGEYETSKNIPLKDTGYTFNKAVCKDDIEVEWDNDLWGLKISNANAKCNLYFDLIMDTKAPTISDITATAVTENSITINVTASDDYGITKYYYNINDSTYEESDSNIHIFSGLSSGTSYSIKVYAIDEAGNTSDISSISKTTNVVWQKYNSSSSSTNKYVQITPSGSGTTYVPWNSTDDAGFVDRGYTFSSDSGFTTTYNGYYDPTDWVGKYLVSQTAVYKITSVDGILGSGTNTKKIVSYTVVAACELQTVVTYSQGTTSYGTITAAYGSLPESGTIVEGSATGSYVIITINGTNYYYVRI